MDAIWSLAIRYKWATPWLRGLAALLLAVLLYWQLIIRSDYSAVWQVFQQETYVPRVHWLLAAIALMPLNWTLETLKWQQFTTIFAKMPFWQAYRAVLAGVTLGLITPQRIGEYGGRVLLGPAGQAWQLALTTLLSNLSQMIVLFSFGLPAFLWFSYNYSDWSAYPLYINIAIAFGLILLFLTGFFSIPYVAIALCRLLPLRLWKKLQRQLVLLRACSLQLRLRALGWAAARYLVYTIQYWLLLLFLGIDVPTEAAFAGIATIFLIQTGVPLPLLGALLARAEIALLVWGQFHANELSILAATFGLFIINLVLPALPGAILLVKSKKHKTIEI